MPSKVKYGKTVPLLVDAEGFQDGRLVVFEIWIRKNGNEEKICEVNGITRREKGIGSWNPEFEGCADARPLREISQLGNTKEEYFFIARIDREKEVKSSEIIFFFPLKIFLRDIDGNPIDGVKYTIKFSDGSEKQGVLSKGIIEFREAPSGKFELELEDGYKFFYEE